MTDSNGRNSNDPLNPMGIGGTMTSPAGGAGATAAPKPRRAAPLKTAATSAGPKASPRPIAAAKSTVRDEAGRLKNDAASKARDYATQGKEKATGALDSFAEMMTDAAAQVDERMGAQYGQYARSAADSVASFSSTLKRKEVDELVGDARDFVRKSPAIAIGAAAAIGFVLARLIKSGVEPADDTAATSRDPYDRSA